MKPVTLHFTRHFLSGTLAGLSHSDSIRFASRKQAQGWIDGIRRISDARIVEYRIIITQERKA